MYRRFVLPAQQMECKNEIQKIDYTIFPTNWSVFPNKRNGDLLPGPRRINNKRLVFKR